MEYKFSVRTNIDAVMTITGLTWDEFLKDCPKYDPYKGTEYEGHTFEYDLYSHTYAASLPFVTADGECIYGDCVIDLYNDIDGSCRLLFNDEFVKSAFQRMMF